MTNGLIYFVEKLRHVTFQLTFVELMQKESTLSRNVFVRDWMQVDRRPAGIVWASRAICCMIYFTVHT